MSTPSLSLDEKARKAHARVLQAMGSPGKGGAIAVALGISDTAVSVHKKEHLERSISVLYALGFKVVDGAAHCVDSATYEFLIASHRRVMERAPELIWDVEE